jgi:predicted phosphoribosyltransferase
VPYSDRIFRDRSDAGHRLGDHLAERHIGGAEVVVLVDDGAATGATMHAAVADEVVALSTPEPYLAVGSWYEVFRQLTDDDVASWLERGGEARGAKSAS